MDRNESSIYLAHLAEDGRKQTVKEHCEKAAYYAGLCLEAIGLNHVGYLAGRIHDIGKMTQKFKNYIVSSFQGEKVAKGSVIHTFTGVRLLLERYHTGDHYQKLASELLAYSVGAHHGLFDCMDENKKSGFQHRMECPDIDYEEAVHNLWEENFSTEQLDIQFQRAQTEIKIVIDQLIEMVEHDEKSHGEELSFYFGLLARLLLSAVIEGDRKDTAQFMGDFGYPNDFLDRKIIWEKALNRMERKLVQIPLDTPLQIARWRISNQCKTCANQPGGVFRLNVPTGAGKTLSVLRFTLAHAKKWNRSRIVFTSPLLSILEQNAAVWREYIGDDRLILEHHSNVIWERSDGENLDTKELLAENWSAPIIITTLVQLLNTFFDGKTSAVRRFQSLCNSIIVIDEIQTVPTNMLSLFNLAINFLVEICHATVVLCSATQPCLEEAERPMCVPIKDMVPYDPELWKAFSRTQIILAKGRKLENMPTFISEILDSSNSLLIICNKKKEAEELFHMLSKNYTNCFHLSAAMCPAHRKETLVQIQNSLANGERNKEKTICVATQVVEAGVDISFASVIRLTAGMENIVQAAGRCNRNHESDQLLPVYVLECQGEQLGRLPDIRRAKDATIELVHSFQQNPAIYQDDLAGDTAIRDYYRILYREMLPNHTDYVLSKKNYTLFSLLADNLEFLEQDSGYFLNQAFQLAGKLFQVFGEETIDVLVPYKEGAVFIEELNSERGQKDIKYAKEILEKAKPYIISLYQYQLEELEQQRGIYPDAGGRIFWINKIFYHDKTGFSLEGWKGQFWEE